MKRRSFMRDGFTLIEIMIALGVLAIISAIAAPFLYDAVIGIKAETVVESAALGIRQLIVDARTRSIKENRVYQFNYSSDNNEFSFKTEDNSYSISYTHPAEFSRYARLEPQGMLDSNSFFVKGLFVVKDDDDDYVLEEDVVSIKVVPLKAEHSQRGLEINIRNGLPILQDGGTE